MKVSGDVDGCKNDVSFKIERKKVSYFYWLSISFIKGILSVGLNIVHAPKPITVCNTKNTE